MVQTLFERLEQRVQFDDPISAIKKGVSPCGYWECSLHVRRAPAFGLFVRCEPQIKNWHLLKRSMHYLNWKSVLQRGHIDEGPVGVGSMLCIDFTYRMPVQLSCQCLGVDI